MALLPSRPPFIYSRKSSSARRGSAILLIVGILVVVAFIAAAVWYIRSSGEDPENQPLLHTVSRDIFNHIVTEQGEVESSSNVEVTCEVKSRGNSGVAIIDVVPEGTHVKEGDLLVTLDSSGLEQELEQQQIRVNSSITSLTNAKAMKKQAEIAKEEYLKGTFVQERERILSEIMVAADFFSRATDLAKFSERLAAFGFITNIQLQADQFNVKKTETDLALAKGKLKTLEDYTKEKMLVGFNSDIDTTIVQLKSEEGSHKVELSKLDEIKQQIANCTIYAPQAGQVVHANRVSSRGGSSEFVVEAGATVRERQTIIRLPDADHMQISANINESRITSIEEGMPVEIQIGAFEDLALKGVVIKVNKYAEPGSWFSSQVKEYKTTIEILDPPADIRTGMTAEVRIYVDRQSDALQIPVQALHGLQELLFCLVKKDENNWETREVEIGATNDKFVVIRKGLEVGDQVVLNPKRYKDLLELPDLPDVPEVQFAKNSKRKSKGPSAGRPQDNSKRGKGGGQSNPATRVARTLESNDTNKDGKLSAEELQQLSATHRDRITAADANGDGEVDRAELTAAFARMANRSKGGGAPKGRPGSSQ